MQNEKLDYYDAMELAAKICGLQEWEEEDLVETALADKFNIGMDEFREIAQFFLDKVGVDVSPLTRKDNYWIC